MRYINNNDINEIKKSIKPGDSGLIVEGALFEKKASYIPFDVFLSHSSKDKEILPSIIKFLERYNVKVYIDKFDKDLPVRTNPETGDKIKKRIGECRKFILLVSDNSKDSKWIPWELGIGDVKKTVSNIALLPKTQNEINPDWPEQEYLGLYPRIVYSTFSGQTSPVWMVLDHHKNEGTELDKWLR